MKLTPAERLAALPTYTTRYRGEDGRERAVLIWENYEWLLTVAQESAKACPMSDRSRHEGKSDRELLLLVIETLQLNMIAQANLDASLKGLTSAVDNAVAALAAGSTSTSTPDNVVAAYQAGVDAQTVRLATATPPPPTPTPAP